MLVASKARGTSRVVVVSEYRVHFRLLNNCPGLEYVMHRNRVLLLLVICLLSIGVYAQTIVPPYSNLRVVPSAAVVGQPVSARVLFDPCREIAPAAGQMTISGTTVTYTITMIEDALCGTPPPSADVDFVLGTFPAGTYTLNFRTVSSMAGVSYPTISTNFTVGAATSIPVLSVPIAALLALVLGLFAWGSLRSR